MTRRTARLMAGLLACAVVLGAPASRAEEQYSARDLLVSSFALWGMMQAAADFCWEQSGYEVAYKEAHENWLARNYLARAELDMERLARGAPESVATTGEAAGTEGILGIFRQATNAPEACATWLSETVNRGRFEPETFLSLQLGLLRERDGM